MMKKLLVAGLVSWAGLTGMAHAMTLEEAALNSLRTPANVERDQYRHPVETLSFFGVKDNLTVVEFWPGGGWYTEILAPLLNENGQYVAANFETNPAPEANSPAYRIRLGKALEGWLETHADKVGNAKTVTFDPPHKTSLGESGSADVVLTFRNMHNWAMAGQAEMVLSAAFDVLKPGGVFGVVEHRAKPGMSLKSGYMEENEVIRLAKAAGFVLADKSEVNANPRDTKDYADGVWTLPPSLRKGDTDKARYLAIGESDRMTLKFVKPAER
ncbi:class I SAM-dependent methyltransferase [Shewanella amazonensis]